MFPILRSGCLSILTFILIGLGSGCRHTPSTAAQRPSEAYLDFTLKACDVVQAGRPEIERVAAIVALRHLNGGSIGFPSNSQALQQELAGRSGGMICTGFDPGWKKERTKVEPTNDIAIISWERPPAEGSLTPLQDAKKRGCYIIGFGPKRMPALAEHVKLSDAWFDTGFGENDSVVRFDDGTMGGRGNALMNTLHGWALTAEIVSALTRHGKMPTMWKSFMCEDGREWGDRYVGKMQFHDDFQIAPIAQGKLAKDYLNKIRGYVRTFQATQITAVEEAASHIAAEMRKGHKTVVATMGHLPWTIIGKFEDARWAHALDLYDGASGQVKEYNDTTPDGALVLRLGYSGQHAPETEIFAQKHQREMLITASDNPRPEWKVPANLVTRIEMGWEFGDACVSIKGYPIKILPPSGVMQIVAYECVNVEVLQRLTEGTDAKR